MLAGRFLTTSTSWRVCYIHQFSTIFSLYSLVFPFLLRQYYFFHLLMNKNAKLFFISPQFSSVQLNRSVMSETLRPHGPQHARPPCPSPTPEDYSSSCPLSQWSHPTISPSVVPFSSCLHSSPASESFQMSQFFRWPSTGVSASTSVLAMNIQDWFPLRLTWLDLLAVQGILKSVR